MNNDKPISLAFTQKWQGQAIQMISEITVKSSGKAMSIKALWDTGASRTCISREVVSALDLIATGKCTNHTAGGDSCSNTYLVDIVLPNKVTIPQIQVSEALIGGNGFDALIGMDIILIGDFSVTNLNRKTTLSFRIPSQKEIDYVPATNVTNKIGKHGPGKRKKKRK